MANVWCWPIVPAFCVEVILLLWDVKGIDSTYIITSPSIVRPGSEFQVSITLLSLDSGALDVSASIVNDDTIVFVSNTTHVNNTGNHMLKMIFPFATWADYKGQYKLKVEGNVTSSKARAFYESTNLTFEMRAVSVFVQLSRAVYRQGQTVHFRVIYMKAQEAGFTVYIMDPTGTPIRRWFYYRTNSSGLATESFELSDQPNFGQWSVQVESPHTVTYKKYFQVEEYEPLKFDVRVQTPPYSKDTADPISAVLKANLKNGRAVKGTGHVTLTLVPRGWLLDAWADAGRGSFPQLQVQVDEFNGKHKVEFNRSEILHNIQSYGTDKFADFICQFNASVIEKDSNFTETGFSTFEVLTARVKLAWMGDNIRIFKPDSVMTVFIAVMHFDGSPVQKRENRTIQLSQETTYAMPSSIISDPRPKQQIVQNGIVKFDVSIESGAQNIVLQAMLDRDPATQITLKSFRFYSPTDNYISISTSTEQPRVNEQMQFHVSSSQEVSDVFYQIVSKGKILNTNVVAMSSRRVTFSVLITAEMSPTATIIVYYETNTGEVVSDSLSFYVTSTFMSDIGITVDKIRTSNKVELKVTALPGATVATVAVPESVFNREIKQGPIELKLLDEINSYNMEYSKIPRYVWKLGDSDFHYKYIASSGNSIDSTSTFEHAGLSILTNATVPKLPSTCYQDKYACFDGVSCYHGYQKCDGYFDCPDDWSDEQGCAFQNSGIPDVTQIFNKDSSFFTDGSWAWRQGVVDSNGEIIFQVEPPKVTMNWIITAFSVSEGEGLRMTRAPFKYDTTSPLSIEVDAPDVVTRGEQIGVKVTVFNNWYKEEEFGVTVIMKGGGDKYASILVEQNGTTSSYSPTTTDEDHSVQITLLSGESSVIFMPIVPKMVKGEFTLQVDILSPITNDSVTKTIRVEADGVTNYYHTPYFIDLSKVEADQSILQIPVPEEFTVPEIREHLYIPGSAETDISLYGGLVRPGFTKYMKVEDIFKKYFTGAEAFLFNIAYNVGNLHYLGILQQLEDGLLQRTLEQVNLDLQNALYYLNSDGSFRRFREDSGNSSSIWLTAFALQTLQEIRRGYWDELGYIKTDLTDKMISFLCTKQNVSGAWNPEEQESVLKEAADIYGHPIPLTAFVVISLYKLRGHARQAASQCMHHAIARGHDYLTNQLPHIADTDIFHLAVTAYALSLKTHVDRTALNRAWGLRKEVNSGIYFSNTDIPETPYDVINSVKVLRHRPEHKNDACAVYSTAYILLTHLKIFPHDSTATSQTERDAMIRWLNNKRHYVGGFVSAQDTLVATHALTEYSLNDPALFIFDMSININTSASPNWHGHVDMNGRNFSRLVEIFPENVYGTVMSEAKGSGKAMLQLSTTVNVEYPWLLKKAYEDIWFYDLEAENVSFRGDKHSILEMTVCARRMYTEYSSGSGLTILEVDIPTGYNVKNGTLREYVRSGKVSNLKEAMFYNRVLIFFFSKMDTSRTCVTFEAQRWYPVANMTIQHRIYIFDQNEPGRQNTTMYSTYNLFNLNICDVCGSYQCTNCPSINDTKQGQPGTTPSVLSTVTMETTTNQTGTVSGSSKLSTNFVLYFILLWIIFVVLNRNSDRDITAN